MESFDRQFLTRYMYTLGGGGTHKWGIYSFWKHLGSVSRSSEMTGLEREVMGEEGGEKQRAWGA